MFPAFALFFLEQECDELEQMLRWHDWYYERSDDIQAYARGYSQYEGIREQVAVVNALQPGLGDDMFNAAKP